LNWIFRKSCNTERNEVVYELNDTGASREEFQSKLIELGFDLDSSFIIDSQAIERITMMPDEHRGTFIEQFCSTNEDLNYYRQLEVKIEAIKSEIKLSLHQKKIIKAEERKKLTKLDILTRSKDAYNNVFKTREQLMLFQLYHNNKERFETRPEAIRQLQESLNDIRDKFSASIDAKKASLKDYQQHKAHLDGSFFKMGEHIKKALTFEQKLQEHQHKVDLLEIESANPFRKISENSRRS
jgi:chromosome segregation ATPase